MRAQQLLGSRSIDSVVAGETHHRAGDAHVDLGGTRLAEETDDLERGGATDDGVVHQHDALALYDAAHGREFHLDSELAHRLHRLDEGTADVLVLDESHLIGDAAFLGIAHGGAEARLRHADNYVGLGRALAVKPPPGFLAVSMDVAAVYVAVGAGEIDVLHAAHPVAEEPGVERAAHTLLINADDLARTYVADERSAHDLEGAGLAADDVTVAELAETEGFDTVLVAAGVYAVHGHDDEGETAFHHVEGLDEVHDAVLVGGLLDEMGQELAVGFGLEYGTVLLEVFLYLLGVHQVAVACHGEVAGPVMEEHGLDVVQSFLACIRILHAADAEGTLELGDLVVVEYLVEKAEAAIAVALAVLVEGGDAAAFLSPVLQVMQTVIDKGRCVLDAVYCKNSHVKPPP